MSRRGLVRAVVPALLGGLMVTGCTTTVRGTASPASTSEAGPTATTSAPPEEPAAAITPPPPEGVGRILESHRIAGATSLVPSTFPDRSEGCGSTAYTTADALAADYFPDPGTVAGTLDDAGFVAAWAQCGARPGGGATTWVVAAELSDPDAAARAAEELSAGQQQSGFEPVPLPGLDATGLQLGSDIEVFVPVGRMLAYAYHQADPGTGPDDLARLMTDQIALLQAFTPTPQADVPGLPADPLGLAGFTLDPPGDFRDESGPYDLAGYLRLAIDPVRERELLTANGFRGFYTKQSDEGDRSYAAALYAFPTSAQTNAVYDAFAQLETAAFGGTKFTLPAIPEAPCFSFGQDAAFYQRCYVGYGSYLASVDVLGLTRADDYGPMNALLPAQRDRIDG